MQQQQSQQQQNDLVYWIWLSLSCTPGSASFSKLLKKYMYAKDIYEANTNDVLKCIDARSSDRANFVERSLDEAQQILDYCNKRNIGILAFSDPRYPNQLRKIHSPPIVLYYRGILPDFNKGLYISIVGTRSLSDYGRKNAFKIAYDLACAGAIVVSGMALGIDGVVHAGVLESGNPTVAVIGCGIDVCYPPQHLKLAREIVKTGCIITEFPPHTKPNGHNFPIRNRIISGLSDATVVIEGRERSGAKITANHAFEQGRAVYALPGNINSSNSETPAILLKNGAKAITSADDIVSQYIDVFPGMINPFKMRPRTTSNMIMEALKKYSVVANAPSDDIYFSRSKKSNYHQFSTVDYSSPEGSKIIDNNQHVKPCVDDRTFKIYTKIPVSGSCPIESLVDADNTLRDVMKSLLALEVSHFIKMEPGERVSRKIN